MSEEKGWTAVEGDWVMLKPGKGKCLICAAEHDPNLPHDSTSIYYQMTFKMEHCTDEMKEMWLSAYTAARLRGEVPDTEDGS